MEEVWKQIMLIDKPTDYYISNYGRVYSKLSNTVLKSRISNAGYHRVKIYSDGNVFCKSVHRLVAIAFLDNPHEFPVVNHKDGDKSNNAVTNLEWCTMSYNNYHAFASGLKTPKVGEESHFAKFTVDQIRQACELMEEGKLTIPKISKLTKVSEGMLFMIEHRRSWTNISMHYDVENCKHEKKDYTNEQTEQVFYLLSTGKYSMYEIMDMTGVKTSTIQNILSGRTTKCRYFYELYDVSNYKKRTIDKLSPVVVNDIQQLVDQNLKVNTIAEIIHMKYGVNTDKIRDYASRRIYKKRSTTRESEVYERNL